MTKAAANRENLVASRPNFSYGSCEGFGWFERFCLFLWFWGLRFCGFGFLGFGVFGFLGAHSPKTPRGCYN